MWGINPISFLMGPAGKVLAVVLLLGAWTAYQRNDATAACEAKNNAKELASVNKQLQIVQGVASTARARADKAQQDLTSLREKTDAILSDINSSGSTCDVPPDLLQRLRELD